MTYDTKNDMNNKRTIIATCTGRDGGLGGVKPLLMMLLMLMMAEVGEVVC